VLSDFMGSGKVQQVLLCGTRYGRSYLDTIDDSKGLELGGILARGSQDSVRLSQQYGVNLFTCVDEIEEKFDLSCIALPQDAGVKIAMKLIQQQIPVLMEHPVSLVNLQLLLAKAKEYGTCCHINSHFAYLEPISQFISHCKKLNELSAAININVSCNSRTLFSVIDILMRSFGTFSISDLKVAGVDPHGHYHSCTFLLDTIALTLTYQNWKYDIDDSKDSPLGHQISVTYPQGVLNLGGTFGPCLWFPLAAGGIGQEIALYNQAEAVYLNRVFYWRNLANRKAMRDLCDSCQDDINVPHYQHKNYLLQLCETWQNLINRFGAPKVIEDIDAIDRHFWQLRQTCVPDAVIAE
jgi:thiazolinyl imide reductase